MMLTTTATLEGYAIESYHGLVSGEAIVGANVFKDLFAGIRDVVGGRAGAYEKTISDARNIALREMCERAEAEGANAVIGVHTDVEAIGAKGSMLMVCANGTAVWITPLL